MKLPSRRGVLAAMTSALVVLPAVAAGAHPSFNPNQVPAGESVDAVLVIPHGCSPTGGMPEGDDALATIEVALRTGDAATVEPRPVDGWDSATEDDVVTWTDAGGATTEVIELPVTLTVSGDEGDELYLEAYQECDSGGSFRWIAKPGEDGWPAVKLVLTAGEVDTVVPSDMDHGSMDHSEMAPTDGATATEDATMHTMTEPEATATAVGAPAAADDGGSGNGAAIAVAVVVLVGLLAAGLVAASRRRRAA